MTRFSHLCLWVEAKIAVDTNMIRKDIYKSVAKYYLRLKLEEAARLAYKKGDMKNYKKYQSQIKKLSNK